MKQKNNLLKVYETDASQIEGKAKDVVFPKTISEIKSLILKSQRICVRGAGTGLAGGAVPLNGEDVVLDLSKLNQISNFDKERKTVEVEAGVILDDLQNFLEDYGLEFPVKPSSHEVCTIGGMIATDAVGSRGVRYGKTSDWVSWIEVLDSSGKIEKKGKTELSDYAGMEGISGVIVGASLKLAEKKKRTADLIEKENFEELVEIVRNLKRRDDVSMIEFFGKQVSELLNLEKKYHLIVEYESGEGKLKDDDYRALMDLRDSLYPLLAKEGFSRIEDPKLMLDKIPSLVEFLEKNRVPVFGHLGVGILHPCFSQEQGKLIEKMMKLIKRFNGYVSGEHGIGLLKKEFVDPNDKKILVNIKKRTDGKNKFNVGKVV